MNQADSANFARELTDFYVRERGEGQNQENLRVHGAVFEQLFEFVPEGAVGALIQREGDGIPIVAAFHDRQLYLLEVYPEEGSIQQPETECRMIHVKPGAGTVVVRTRYFQRHGTVPARSTSWRFEFSGGPTLTIQTHLDPDGEVEPREALARMLAAGLGWQMDLPAREFGMEAA